MVAARDKRFGFDTAKARQDRRDLTAMAKPQGGVDAMAGMFPNAQPTMEGVQDNGDAATTPVPSLSMTPARPR
jgi:hypothetical protein